MTRIRLLTVTALTMGLVGGMAPAAFAGDVPSPNPTFTRPVPTPQTCATRPVTFTPTASPADEVSTAAYRGHPTPTPTPTVNPQRCSPEAFRIFHADVGRTSLLNLVIASGPVFGTGSDRQLADTRNVFDLPSALRSVNVRHTGIGAATFTTNLPTCTISLSENGVWRFRGGTGLFSRAVGNGVFALTGQWKFGNVRTPRGPVCALRFVRPGVNPLLVRGLNSISDSFSVVGVGLARR